MSKKKVNEYMERNKAFLEEVKAKEGVVEYVVACCVNTCKGARVGERCCRAVL